mgnify:CR=1 FL=1
MDNSYIEDLRKQVKKALKEDKMRYRHTLGVADTSACLAMRYGVDMQKAYIAGLLHDCAKCVPDTVKLEECNRYGIEVTEFEKNSLISAPCKRSGGILCKGIVPYRRSVHLQCNLLAHNGTCGHDKAGRNRLYRGLY